MGALGFFMYNCRRDAGMIRDGLKTKRVKEVNSSLRLRGHPLAACYCRATKAGVGSVRTANWLSRNHVSSPHCGWCGVDKLLNFHWWAPEPNRGCFCWTTDLIRRRAVHGVGRLRHREVSISQHSVVRALASTYY